MKTAFIIHGTYGSPEENWFPWMKKNLELLDYDVIVPKLPTPEGQNLDNWLQVFSNYKDKLNQDSIFIGHSLGASFILTLLETNNVKAVFLISGFIGPLNNPQFDILNRSFTEKKFDWEIIRKNCNIFFVYHSDNDPYIPVEKAEELAHNLGTTLIVIENAGHFNEKAGYNQFPELLKKIKELN